MTGGKGPKRTLPRQGMGWLPALLMLLLVLAIVGAAFYLMTRTKAVATTMVQRGTVVRAFYATGTVRPDYEYVLKSRAQGILSGLEKREGAFVSKGQVLARVDDRQLKFETEKCKAELVEAQQQATERAPQRLEVEARLKEAMEQSKMSAENLQRVEQSYASRGASFNDLDSARRLHVQWESTVTALESQLGTWKIESQRKVDVAAANLQKAEANLADADVMAPIDGIILERYVEDRQVVGINEKLFLIAAPRDLLMKAAVDEEDITRTRIGQKVEMQLYAYQGRDRDLPRILEGRVIEILPIAVNKTTEVKVKFAELPEGLRVGMTGELNFIEQDSAKSDALLVPASAVLDKKVYRARAGGLGGGYEAVPIKIGIRTLEKVEILGGLKEGDVIVADAKQVAPVKLPPTQAPIVPTRTGDAVADK